MDIEIKLRACADCGKPKPLTKQYWNHVIGGAHEFQLVCKACKAEAKRKKKMDAVEKRAVTHFVNHANTGGSNIPHTAELLESIMSHFGGVHGFGSMLMKQFFDAPPGGRIRTSIMEMVVKLGAKNTEQGGARKPMQLYTEEELESEIEERLKKLAKLYQQTSMRSLNGPAQDAITAELAQGPPDDSGSVVLPVRGTESLSSRIEREAARSCEAIQADGTAVGVPPIEGE